MQSRLPTVLLVVGVPFTLIVLCFGYYNKIEPVIFGFPFLYAWLFSCLGISSISMYIGWKIDPKSEHNLRKAHEEAQAQGKQPGKQEGVA